MTNWRVDGKLALVTGAAGLLGLQHVLALLEIGATVVASDLSIQLLNERYSSGVFQKFKNSLIFEELDVGREDSILILAKKYLFQILINNAAVNPQVFANKGLGNSSRLEFFALDEWNRQISIGLTGAFLCAKSFGQKMAESGLGGVILNIASDLSVIAPDQRLYRREGLPESQQDVKPITYSVVKTGLIGLTRYLASYWADKGVRCNALSPGGVENNQGDVFLGRIKNLIPMGRMAKVDEYQGAVQFLCSDASLYMTGQNIVIDGGRTVV
jgi:NAD(P)-dependent dehydrogenase (short-subunit alcohol dehydrogenase family)